MLAKNRMPSNIDIINTHRIIKVDMHFQIQVSSIDLLEEHITTCSSIGQVGKMPTHSKMLEYIHLVTIVCNEKMQ